MLRCRCTVDYGRAGPSSSSSSSSSSTAAAAAAAAAASGPRRGQDAVDVTVINITTTVINDNKEHIK